MGLFELGRKRKERQEFLLRWQKTIMQNSPDRLVMTEEQLRSATMQQAKNDLRIMKESAELVDSTYKPDVFFSRLNLLIEKAKHLATLEEYIPFAKASPAVAYNEFLSNRNETIRWFLIRYHTDFCAPASAFKSKKSRLNRYQKWYDSLQEHYCHMTAEHIDFIETRYKYDTEYH